ncbi:MerR family transcriptional regulator [Pseudonocardia eucalypti]|uniref:MerR family transcriptional regulator n=1 Tax=Pseudonocardia eucalypti TaxID=648755 RepID=A0ABP9RFR2_9PSEU|nr:DNA-binding transcriptional MerR regulator [Pseudonocardia eucalypti]
MTRYRIDELAQASGVTVRNIRAYQDHGILPAPRREGRVGIYSDAHLARLRVITQLLGRGYTVATITELLTAWTQGRDLSEILGLEQVVTGFWGQESAESMTVEEVHALFGAPDADDLIEKAIHAELVEREEKDLRVPSPRLLRAAAELVTAGVPLDGVLELVGRLGRAVDSAMHDLIVLFYQHFLREHGDQLPRGEEVTELTALAQRFRPLTAAAMSAMLTRSMERHVDEVIGSYIARLIPGLNSRQAPFT